MNLNKIPGSPGDKGAGPPVVGTARRVPRSCQQCRKLLPGWAQFCRRCGTAVAAPAPPPIPQRRPPPMAPRIATPPQLPGQRMAPTPPMLGARQMAPTPPMIRTSPMVPTAPKAPPPLPLSEIDAGLLDADIERGPIAKSPGAELGPELISLPDTPDESPPAPGANGESPARLAGPTHTHDSPPAAAHPVDFTNTVGMSFVRIAPGSFLMGSPLDEEGRSDDEVQHKVTLTRPFLMQTTPVTELQWSRVMGESPMYFEGDDQSEGDDRPANHITWNEAAEFCERLSEKEGKNYRLPTEAEWEYACRAGTTTRFHTGNDVADLDEACWYAGNCEQTQPVMLKKPNAWGLYDMHGSVREWCSDYYGPYEGDVEDPQGPPTGASRVLRGAAWLFTPQDCRSAFRSRLVPDHRASLIGFRVCVDV